MSESRTFYAKRNMRTGIINRIIILGLPFVIRTIIIRTLGAEYLGLSSLFSSILQVLNMAELGFSSAVVFSLYKPIAEENTDEVCALMGFYRKVYKIIGIAILVVGSSLLPFLPKLIKGAYPLDTNIYILYTIYLGNTAISYLAFAYKNVLFSASQRQDILNNINTVISIVKFCLQIILLLIFKNYYLYIIWNIIFTFIENVVVAFLAKKEFPEYVCRGSIEKEKKSDIAKQINGLAIGQLTKVSRNSFDSVVLSMYCGLIEVAIYSNYYYVFNAVLGILSVITTSINAGIGNSIAVDTVEKSYKDFKKFYYYFSWIGSVCTSCFFCLYQPFMKIWVGNDYMASFFTMTLFCIYFWIIQAGLLRSVYANAAGIWWENRWVQLGEMLCNLILNFVLGYYFGINGVLIATILTVFIFCILGQTKILYKIFFKRRFLEYLMDTAKYFLFTFFSTGITYFFTQLVSGDSLILFLTKIIITVLVSNITFLSVSVLNRKRRKYIIELITRIAGKCFGETT